MTVSAIIVFKTFSYFQEPREPCSVDPRCGSSPGPNERSPHALWPNLPSRSVQHPSLFRSLSDLPAAPFLLNCPALVLPWFLSSFGDLRWRKSRTRVSVELWVIDFRVPIGAAAAERTGAANSPHWPKLCSQTGLSHGDPVGGLKTWKQR